MVVQDIFIMIPIVFTAWRRIELVPALGQLKDFLGLIKQSRGGGEVQVRTMKTMAWMLHQRLSNKIVEIDCQAKAKAVLVNALIFVIALLILISVLRISFFMSIGGFLNPVSLIYCVTGVGLGEIKV